MEAAKSAGPTVEDAVRLAEKGFHVFPCKPGEKEPATPNGHRAASNDPEKVRRLFAGPSDYNIGLVPGRSGHVVVDVDSEEGESELRRLWGEIPDTVSWTTGKGRHRLYRTPVPLRSRNRVATDLDVKAEGGYVVVPPSIHPSGGRYSFETGTGRVAALTEEQATALAPASEPRPAPPQEELQAPSLERLSDVVAKIPNAGERFASRDAYLQVGYAIKAAAGPGNEGEALEIFQAWASRWEDGDNDPATVRKDFEGMHGPYRTGWPYLLELAGEIHTLAADAFDADQPAPDPAGEAQNPLRAGIMSVSELVRRPREAIKWVVPDLLARGRLSILAAKPKVGKSTILRLLLRCLPEGEPWIGFDTEPGRVLYVALEEHPDDVAAHLEELGCADADGADVYVGRVNKGTAVDDLREVLTEAKEAGDPYSLAILDTAFEFLPVEDGNDYALTKEDLGPVREAAHKTGTHVMLVHHLRKSGAGDPFDAILGSTGIWAAFDAGMIYQRAPKLGSNYRTMLTRGRRHVEGSWTVVSEVNGELHAEGSYSEAKASLLHGYLSENGPESYDEIAAGLDWSAPTLRKYMTMLEEREKVERIGEGVKGDPYRWAAVSPETEFDADMDASEYEDLSTQEAAHD